MSRVLLMLGVLLGLCTAAIAQTTENLAIIYDGQNALPANITLGNWGFTLRTNAADAFKPVRYSRTFGITLHTMGRYQGARFDFGAPIDTDNLFGVKNTYLELYLRAVPDDKTATTGEKPKTGDPGSNPTNPPPPPPPPPANDPMRQPPPGGNPGGGPGGPGNPGGPGVPGAVDPNQPPAEPPVKVPTVPLPNFTNLRFTFFTEKGQGQLVVTPDQFFPKEEINGRWVRLDIPLTLLNDKLPVGGKLQRMLITSDDPADYIVGRIAFVRDVTPLTVKTTVFPLFLEAGQRIVFIARVEAGLSRYETTWNFGANGPEAVDATGDRVTYTFDKEGNYTITCKVRDLSDGKDPVFSKFEVKVSRAR
jgi:hypothetical protein